MGLRPRWSLHEVPVLLAAVALAPLALLETSAAMTVGLIVVLALAVSAALRLSPRTDHPLLTAAPLLLALLGVVALAPATIAAEGLAGFAGLGVLVAVTWSPERRTQRLLAGLFLPASSVALAFVVALAFPVGEQDLRVALLVLLAAIGFLAWALPRAGPGSLATPS